MVSINDAPIAGDTAFSMSEDSVITLSSEQLLATSSDIEGEVSLESVSYSGTDGIFTDNGDGSYSFAPNENFNGDISLDIVVVDADGATDTATAGVEVGAVNDAPVAGDIAYSINEDGSVTLSQEQLLATSSDVDGDDLTAGNVTGGDNVSVTDNGDGTFTLTPDADFNGDLSLSFDVTDGGETVSAGIELSVNPVNDLPVVADQSFSMNEDGTITITDAQLLQGATDIDGDNLSIADVSYTGTDGVFTDNGDGSYSFAPNENFNGDIALDIVVVDADGATDTATVNVDVTPTNDAPDAPAIDIQGTEDQVLTIDPNFILNQVTDIDGDDLTLESLTIRQPENATLTQNSDGMYQLVAPQDFNGMIELAYQVSDGTEEVTGSLNVDVIPVNDGPFVNGNAYKATVEDEAITFDADDLIGLFGDIDGDDLTISRVITAEGEDGGEVTDNGDGTYTFTPTADFSGTAGLQVVVSDGQEEAVMEMPVYIRPVADGAAITTDHEGPLVFGEDTTGHFGLNVDMLDDSESLSNLVITGFPVGFVVGDGENSVTITEEGQVIDITSWDFSDLEMTPPQDFNGSFSVTVTSTTVDYGDESSDNPNAPYATADFDMEAGEAITMTTDELLAMADGLELQDGDDVGLVHLVDRSQGEMTDNGDGTYTFTPSADFSGQVDFAYVVERGDEVIDVQSTIDVNSVEEVVDANAQFAAADDGSISITPESLIAGMDSDSDNISINDLAYSGDDGTLISNDDGSWTFWPDPEFSGDINLDITASDGDQTISETLGLGVTATVEEDARANASADSDVETEQVAPATDDATDYSAAPGDDFTISIPEDIAGNADVDHVIISDLPEGAEISSGLENEDGDYVISGDLSQPITVTLGDDFEGEIDMQISGYNESDVAVDGATDHLTVDVDADNVMQGSSSDNANLDDASAGDVSGDWTTTDNTDAGVDILDDSNLGDMDTDNSGTDDDLSDLGGIG